MSCFARPTALFRTSPSWSWSRPSRACDPVPPDNAPLVGPGALHGLVLATGHYRNGILLAPISAEAVAALLAQDPPPPEAEVAHPGRFAGESAPGLVAAPTIDEAPR